MEYGSRFDRILQERLMNFSDRDISDGSQKVNIYEAELYSRLHYAIINYSPEILEKI